MMRSSVLFSFTVFAIAAKAQVGAWGQCGGINYSGSTTCVSGYTCSYVNDYYSQCIPGTATTTLATSTRATTTTAATSAAATGLKWLGVSESVAEFGTAIPGTWGVDFYFPSTSTIDTLISEGFNVFRIPFMMERMARGSVSATLDSGYLNNLTAVVNHITGKGKYAVLDAHNYGRYSGAVITDTSAFATFWKNLATPFKSNSYVIFDLNNEYHDMDQTLVFNLNQAAITAIRGVGATSQYIFAEGNSWTGAWTWNTTNGNLASLSDPQGKLVYEMHQYLDSDGSGSSSTCVSSTVGVDRVVGATNWLRANGKKGVLGEFAGGPNSQCLSAVTGLLDHLKANSDVWQGALWWAAGPWWPADTYAAFEPPNGIAYKYYDATLRRYVPSS